MSFDEIRPFSDEEVPAAIERLLTEPSFHNAIRYVFPDKRPDEIVYKLKQIQTIDDFQASIIAAAVRNIQISTTRGIRHEGLDQLNKNGAYLFISNHRDIVLDSAFLNYLLHSEGFPTTRIAIGNNLLQKEWISDLVRLNKNFIVHRDIPSRQAYDYSLRLSKYIRHSIEIDHASIWIAQKEGRTKDGVDRTHSGLLKMFGMSWEEPLEEAFSKLNIVPVSISYELEPCAGMKAFEMYIRSVKGSYEKEPGEDLQSMRNGIAHKKGRVVYSFGKQLNKDLFKLLFEGINKNEGFKKMALKIDDEIHSNYHLFPFHYLAHDKINNSNRFSAEYSEDDLKLFEIHIEEQLAPCKASREELMPFILQIYSNPVELKMANNLF